MGTHPIFESDFDCLTEFGYKNNRPWVVCTHQERVSPRRPCHTDEPYHRDTHGVGKSHYLTGSKILRVLKSLGVAPDLPEDLYFMIKKAVGMRKHLERNRKDRDGKFRLILIESRIHRLSRYYRKKGV